MTSSAVGEYLFGYAFRSIATKHLQAQMQTSLKTLAESRLTPVAIANAREAFVDFCKTMAFNASQTYAEPKNIKCSYCGVTITLQATSLLNE